MKKKSRPTKKKLTNSINTAYPGKKELVKSDKRDVMIRIRVSEDEKKKFDRIAAMSMATLSTMIRTVVSNKYDEVDKQISLIFDSNKSSKK